MQPELNYLAIIVAGLVPTVIGALYYGPLFEKPWLASLGKTKEEMVPKNMALTYGGALVTAMLLSMSLKMLIELTHRGVENGALVFNSDHNFGHGALHGALICLSIIVPVIISLSLFQGRSGKNILLNVVYWTITCSIMGGILDAWI